MAFQCDYRVFADTDVENIDPRTTQRARQVDTILLNRTRTAKLLLKQQVHLLAQTLNNDDLEVLRGFIMQATVSQDLKEQLKSCDCIEALLTVYIENVNLVPWWDWEKIENLYKILPVRFHPKHNQHNVKKAADLQCSTIQRDIEEYFQNRTYELEFEGKEALICLTDCEWKESEAYGDIASMLGTDNNGPKYKIVVFCSVSTAMHRKDVSPPQSGYFDQLLHKSEATREVDDSITDFDQPCQGHHDNPCTFVLPGLPVPRFSESVRDSDGTEAGTSASADNESKFSPAQTCQTSHDNLCTFVVSKQHVPEPISNPNSFGVEYILASSSCASDNTGDLQPVVEPFK